MPEIIMTVMIVLCLFLILLLYLQHKNLRHIREQLTWSIVPSGFIPIPWIRK